MKTLSQEQYESYLNYILFHLDLFFDFYGVKSTPFNFYNYQERRPRWIENEEKKKRQGKSRIRASNKAKKPVHWRPNSFIPSLKVSLVIFGDGMINKCQKLVSKAKELPSVDVEIHNAYQSSNTTSLKLNESKSYYSIK
ncbi:MAG: hypothetical protein EXX96DRAFT_536003 [Benjaminiella poitrasii]|nr:MAG: hypothetical protein EXX96DRAFT_536003 [Benjaminiella poitrasii]